MDDQNLTNLPVNNLDFHKNTKKMLLILRMYIYKKKMFKDRETIKR